MRWHILAQPFHQVQSIIKEAIVLHWQVGFCNGGSPLKLAAVSFHIAIDDLKEIRHRQWILAKESDLLTLLNNLRPSIAEERFSTFNIWLPTSRNGWKMIPG